ncbi:septum site-determining protein MinC [Bacillus tianshenii]|uniref:Probable septum site-determining protein MinC n=1 Tax=Sutcliffiella tianshenii TaxID=1463404 RepID=A0ABS2P1Z5_9BACI|nr:septum site-determining protein MinC [Bacillus tianshenii]MBM7620450.1 septum site-determining protein MinC [Bacillus tianshenii]
MSNYILVEVNVVNRQKQQYVTIKGTKEGLTLHLDDTCSFQELLAEIEAKLASNSNPDDSPLLGVRLKVGNRFLTNKQQEKLRNVIRSKKNFIVEEIESNVITKEQAIQWKEENEIVPVARMVRSGQVLEVKGDLLLIGDVNPGGTVKAGGNIFVLGALRGNAYAGLLGNNEAVIAASLMRPTLLSISETINRAPDLSEQLEGSNEMECAYIDKNEQIIIDRLQLLSHLRPMLTRLERRM